MNSQGIDESGNKNPSIHPLNTGRYLLRTKRINQLEKQIFSWVEMRVTGALIVGRQRYGKTHARHYMANSLANKFPGLRVIEVPCRHETKSSEKTFFMHLLKQAGHAISNSRKEDVSSLRRRLNEYLKMFADESGINWVVMFLDDSQCLHENQYTWLMDIHNEMKQVGVSFGCYLFGQPELIHQRNSFMKGEMYHLIARFMLHVFNFYGLKSADDLSYCLSGYDSAEYPPGSGISYTSHFFPESFSAGWRCKNLAPMLWECFMQISKNSPWGSHSEIPMEFFTRTVERIFMTHANTPIHIDKLTPAQITNAIQSTGYIDYTKVIPSKDKLLNDL